jgi:formate hydrogenlyase subunit 3/multisubunit Na+/H+ antiporter MnhD subunit
MGKRYFFTYALYEISTLPILFLILSGGASKKRGEAGIYLFIFTIRRAIILFLILFFICEKGDSLSNSFYQNIFVMQEEKFIISHYFFFFTRLGIVLTFLVKFPRFLLHI